MIINENIPNVSYNNSFVWGQDGVPFAFKESKDEEPGLICVSS